MRLESYRQILVKYSNIKFNENSLRGKGVVASERTEDRHYVAKRRFSQVREIG